MRNSGGYINKFRFVLLSSILFVPGTAFAQTADETAEDDAVEIVVTAQKREERLQDVALSVSVVSADTLSQNGITRFDDLPLPAVKVAEGGANNPQFIRGIGSGFNSGFEQSAPLYSDGIWFGRAQTQRLAFLDVGRIEVLKGPQPTYLGKNAIAGAITVISARPTNELEAGLQTSYEFNADELDINGYVSGPIAGDLKGRFAFRYGEMEGFMHNVATDQREPSREDVALRGTLVWDGSDNFDILVKGEYIKFTELGRNTQLIACLPGGQYDPLIEDCTLNLTRASTFVRSAYDPIATPFLDYSKGEPTYREIELKNFLTQANWSLGDYVISGSVGYYEQKLDGFVANSQSTRQRLAIRTAENFSFLSGELRITSPADRPIEWLAGVYFDDSETSMPSRVVAPPTSTGFDSNFETDSSSWSAFGEVGVKLVDTLKLKLGFRYTEVDKIGSGFSDTYLVSPAVVTLQSQFDTGQLEFSDDSFDPAVTLEWKPIEDVLAYASWRQGFKSGGFDSDLASTNAAALVFRSEGVNYYEAGVKWTIARGTTLNLAAFRGDYTDLQTSASNPLTGGFTTQNAAAVRSQGIEAEAMWRAASWLTFNGSVSYLDSTYRDFTDAPCYNNPVQTLAQGCVTVAGVRTQDLTGAHTAYAPEWSGSFGATIRYPAGFDLLGGPVTILAGGTVFATSKYSVNFLNDPEGVQEGFAKIDARIGLAGEDDRWQLAVVGRNLTNKITASFIGDQPRSGNNSAHFAVTERPREIALQFGVSF